MSIGKRLKSTRIDHDHKQKDTAAILNVNEKQIIRYEDDRQEMGIEKLKKFCLQYQVSADYILGLPQGLEWPRKPKGGMTD